MRLTNKHFCINSKKEPYCALLMFKSGDLSFSTANIQKQKEKRKRKGKLLPVAQVIPTKQNNNK